MTTSTTLTEHATVAAVDQAYRRLRLRLRLRIGEQRQPAKGRRAP